MASGHHCVIVTIEDDNVPEPDETFGVVFTELIPDLAGCSMMGRAGSGGGGIMMKTDGMLMSMVSNETVTIAIIDNDMQERDSTPGDRSAAIAGAVCGSLLAVVLIAIICLILFNYFNKRRKRLMLFRSTAIDHSEIPPIYEEIPLEKTPPIELNTNEAYGHISH
ncbi:hypothetical protein GBAR_LOCUS7513 [Geodia barretti]|uniref:Uncharacterized protein n=1 Tax=Geodia barretti TaxID=519541 RepID=A0AA35RIE3_GEOBA|nr:hypothetical protein GBAR_LOCUS7513 [Geodia barretti]